MSAHPAVDMARLMRPRSIAIVGVSAEPTSAGRLALRNLEDFGYDGEIHLVSRNQTEVAGRRCVRSIDDLPDAVDAAMLIIPRVAIEAAVVACARRGVGAVLIFAAGFGEAGGEWLEAQNRIATTARDAGMALVGPNCLGIIDFVHNVPLTFASQIGRRERVTSGAAVVAQSGGLVGVVRGALAAKGIPVTCTVSTGNEAGLGLEDYAAYLIEDESTKVVVAFAEQIRNPPAFLAMAKRARTLGKPVVLLLSGHSDAARESARSHTGALAGDYAVIETMLRHSAVILVESLEELIDVSELAARFPVPPTKGLAMVTDSGAIKGMTLDYCETLGLDLPLLSSSLSAEIQKVLPEFVGASNPLDLTAQAITHPDMYARTISPMLADDIYGSLLTAVIIGNTGANAIAKGKTCLAPLIGSRKPVVFGLLGDEVNLPETIIADSRAAGVPFYRSPERAMRALARFTAYGRGLERARGRVAPPPLVAPALPGRGMLTEHAGKSYLAGLGIAMPAGGLAVTLADALQVARSVSYPVALKLQAAALPHKSDAGAVVLGIADETGLRAGWERLQTVAAAHSGLTVDGVLVEAMAPPGVELIVGGRRDLLWGPVMLVGLGGIWAEALDDVRILPVDLPTDEIVEEIGRLKAARVLQGMRGAPPCDLAALAHVVQRIGALLAARAEIREIDINPLRVYERGVLALDALIVTEPST